MNKHLEADHLWKCSEISCLEPGLDNCCLKEDASSNVTAYCCNFNDYLDLHIIPPVDNIIHGVVVTVPITHPETGYGEDQVVQESTPATYAVTPITPNPHPPSQSEALGWTYIGIASGVVVLVMFILVLVAILYIFYRWRAKERENRESRYQSESGHAVVVYRNSPDQQIETSSVAIKESYVQPSTSNIYSPPPYSSEQRTEDTTTQEETMIDSKSENERGLKLLPETNSH